MTNSEDPNPVRKNAHPGFQHAIFRFRKKGLAVTRESYYVLDAQGEPVAYVERPHLLGGCAALLAAGVVFVLILGIGLAIAVFFFAHDNSHFGISSLLAAVGAFVAAVWMVITFSPKWQVAFYSDDAKLKPLLRISQRRPFIPIHIDYFVTDGDGGSLGKLRRIELCGFIRRRWNGYSPDGLLLFVAKENPHAWAPRLATSFSHLLFHFPLSVELESSFVLYKQEHLSILGNVKRSSDDMCVVDLTPDRDSFLDRRLALALGIMLVTEKNI